MRPDFPSLRTSLLLALCGPALAGCPGMGTPTPPGSTEACQDPVAVLGPNGQDTGYVRCADGSVNKIAASSCDASVGAPQLCEGTERVQNCTTNADCTEGANGVCASEFANYGGGYYGNACRCVYPCANDSECGPGMVCGCAGLPGMDASRCIPAGCDVGLDCTSGECGYALVNNGCGDTMELGCRTADDVCRTGETCDDPGAYDANCSPEGLGGAWACSYPATCGRPLLVDGRARMSRPILTSDWAAGEVLDLDGAGAALREAVADHWEEIGALEHASVASFARATLQLMALGAPPDLLLDTQRAAADEVDHARKAYGVASQYRGAPVGPGPLVLTDLQVETDRAAVTRALVEEACVGETLGAAEALAAAEGARDPALRDLMRQVGQDELRHAALAWRTLRWVVGDDPALVEVAREALRRVTAGYLAEEAGPGLHAPAHGVLGPRARQQVRREALVELVGPVVGAMGLEAWA